MNTEELDWKNCYDNFHQKIKANLNHQEHLETSAELEASFRDLATRYARGERSLELYQAMENVE